MSLIRQRTRVLQKPKGHVHILHETSFKIIVNKNPKRPQDRRLYKYRKLIVSNLSASKTRSSIFPLLSKDVLPNNPTLRQIFTTVFKDLKTEGFTKMRLFVEEYILLPSELEEFRGCLQFPQVSSSSY